MANDRVETVEVLLIDDVPDDRALILHELKRAFAGVQSHHVTDPQSLAHALDQAYDIAITDFQLGWTTGLDVVRQLKTRHPQKPVVMFTSSGNEDVAVKAIKIGLDDYLNKSPKQLPKLAKIVRNLVEEYRRRTGRPRVLLIDDDAASLAGVSEMLRLRLPDTVIETSANGTEALQWIGAREYEAIIVDVKMPGVDGLALMRRIKELRPFTPVLLISGHGDHALSVKALRAGAYAFMSKPLDREHFVAWVERAIELRRLSLEVERVQQQLERHRAELESLVNSRTGCVQAHETRMFLAMDLARLGFWCFNRDTGSIEASSWCKTNLGLSDNSELTFENFLTGLYHQDRDRIRHALEQTMDSGVPLREQCRVVMPHGDLDTILFLGKRNDTEKGTALFGVVQNITDMLRNSATSGWGRAARRID
jgi:CheY-like chemotaxis protein